MNEKIQRLASELCQALITSKRNDGKEYTHLKDGSPAWMTDVIRTGHGDSFPDDTIYEFIDRVACALADADPDADDHDVISEIEADMYTYDLTTWLHASVSHVYYITQALKEFGSFDDGFNLLMASQKMHIDEIAYALLNALENLEDPDGGEGGGIDEDRDCFFVAFIRPDGVQVVRILCMDRADYDYDWTADNNVYPFGS